MALPNVSREQLIDAMLEWDRSGARQSYDWKQNRYVVVMDTQAPVPRYYPPKAIISLATGRGVDTFSGGRGSGGANTYLEKRGFTVIDLAEVGRDQVGLAS